MKDSVIFFDIDDTLFDSTQFRSIVRRKSLESLNLSLRKFGFNFSDDFLYAEFEKIYQQDKNSNLMYDRLLESIGVPEYQISKHVALAVITWEDTKTSMEAFPNVKEVLGELKARGYHMGIASAGLGVKQWDKLTRIGIADFFDPKFVFITAETNGFRRRYTKDKLFYHQIKNSYTNLHFKKFYMVGDKFAQDIDPAHQAGFETFMIKSDHFKEEYLPALNKMGTSVFSNFRELLTVF